MDAAVGQTCADLINTHAFRASSYLTFARLGVFKSAYYFFFLQFFLLTGILHDEKVERYGKFMMERTKHQGFGYVVVLRGCY